MGMPQGWEWIYILVIALLLFGAKRLPEIGRSLGKGMREFKQSISGLSEDEDEEKVEGVGEGLLCHSSCEVCVGEGGSEDEGSHERYLGVV